MRSLISEYGSSDTSSGFLRWSRPAEKKPSVFHRFVRALKVALEEDYRRSRLTVAVLCGVILLSILSYILTLLMITYRPSLLLAISVEKISMQEVWCGMVTLVGEARYCARGTAELRVRNKLWCDLTIRSWFIGTPYNYIHQLEDINVGNYEIDGTVVKAFDESVLVLPVTLVSFTGDDSWLPKTNHFALQLDVFAMGWRFNALEYDVLQKPNFIVPT